MCSLPCWARTISTSALCTAGGATLANALADSTSESYTSEARRRARREAAEVGRAYNHQSWPPYMQSIHDNWRLELQKWSPQMWPEVLGESLTLGLYVHQTCLDGRAAAIHAHYKTLESQTSKLILSTLSLGNPLGHICEHFWRICVLPPGNYCCCGHAWLRSNIATKARLMQAMGSL